MGGADKVAWDLFRAYKKAGYQAWMVVGEKHSKDPDVFIVPNDQYRSLWAKVWIKASGLLKPLVGKVPGAGRARRFLMWIGQPKRYFNLLKGWEDFDFPGTWHILDLLPQSPQIIHCHNLHGEYFDLRALPWLSNQFPVVLTLHDEWLFTGHCSHPMNCSRWMIGCGDCPSLYYYPPVKKDATRYNWGVKRNIYRKSKLFIATPCHWLMERVKKSILMEGAVECRVIPYGIDLSIFHPSNRREAREKLGFSPDEKIVLFVSKPVKKFGAKDMETLKKAIIILIHKFKETNLRFVTLGANFPIEKIEGVKVSIVSYQKTPEKVALYYRAADVYAHSAFAETFPLVILEAMACGLPVVATNVGGIPEQISHGENGFLVPPQNAEAMAFYIKKLLSNPELQKKFFTRGREKAEKYYEFERQVETYIKWYKEILKFWQNFKSEIEGF